MGKLIVYNFLSLNGYYKGENEDISWAKQAGGKEENEFAASNLQSGSTLVFGRVTFQMMRSYWPSTEAAKNQPEVAEGMNKAEKIVFSRTLDKADWNNSKVIKGDPESEMRKLKSMSDQNFTILGSGSIIRQLVNKGLIDEYQLMIHPVLIEKGTPFAKDLQDKLDLELTGSRAFKSGIMHLTYRPAKSHKDH